MDRSNILDIYSYMKCFSAELGQRILADFPALQRFEDPISPLIKKLLRRPFPAQAIAMMGVAKRWEQRRSAAIVAECGTGKTLMSLGAVHVHAEGQPFTAIAMVPPHLVEKWAREAIQTIPGIRVFIVDDLRNEGDPKAPHGVNEVRLQGKRIVRKGLHTSLTDLRLSKSHRTARERWRSICSQPSLFIVGRERAKLGYFWRHAYEVAASGNYLGSVVNPESGQPIVTNEQRLLASDFDTVKIAEVIEERAGHSCKKLFSPLWQADNQKIPREAPIDFIGRYMHGFFDYAICDEMHQLAGDTAQGNALGTLASCAGRLVGLTGTLSGGYAKDLNNLLWRFEAAKMKQKGFIWGANGSSAFVSEYGVLETIETIRPADNACSEARVTTTVKQRPGASPLLFGEFLMGLCAFVFLEDIADRLPSYEENLVSVPMDPEMFAAYSALEIEIKECLKQNRKNRSVLSQMLNTLLLYPDHPFGIGTLHGKRRTDRGSETFVIARPKELPQDRLYSKERKLIERVKAELAEGRLCHVFAVYTKKHDVTARINEILSRAGIRTAVLKSTIPTTQREAWYAKKVAEGVQVVICHPKLVETGLDLLEFPTLIFYETGYSLHTLRQASRRSWRIGQGRPVKVFFFCQEGTMQTKCLRLMGKKLLVALTLEGKFASEGLHDMEDDDDMLSAMARELVQENGIGETADQIWSQLRDVYDKLPTAANSPVIEDEQVPFAEPEPVAAIPEAPISIVHVQNELLAAAEQPAPVLFGQPIPSGKRKSRNRPQHGVPQQAFLFTWN
ncbi:MAG TPA: helicase-related protein [Candidatus Angelobacter sp.]|nr:helicase-related protein [Candidatus Angelobacter sp.]